MHIPRFILITFIALVVGGTLLATGMLASSSEPRLGESIVVTPDGTPAPTTPPTTPGPSPTPGKPPATKPATPVPSPPSPEGAVVVPGCAPLVGDDDCDDEWDDYYDDLNDD